MTEKQLSAPPLFPVFMLSATALAYEVLLVRIFSIIHWHHFAFMIISIALLGYGVSGSFIMLFRDRLLDQFDSVFIANALLFGLAMPACFIIVQHTPFNALEILWDSSQWTRLLLSYLLLSLPFFFVANAIALSLMRYHSQIAMIYGVDLFAAGVGAVSIMALLQFYAPEIILKILPACAISSILLFTHNQPRKNRLAVTALVSLGACMVIITPSQWTSLKISEYKSLQQTLLMQDAVLLQRHHSSIAQTDVVNSDVIPFRNAPGLSLHSPAGPPPQLAVFRDGDEMNTIDQVSGPGVLEYYNYMSSALPYHLKKDARNVLILNSSTGSQILQARLHDVLRIDAVEPDPQLSRLITDDYADYFDWPGIRDRVRIFTISARGFSATQRKYDLVILGPGGGSAGSAAGVNALSTSYDFTVEALQDYIMLLAPQGLLSISLWTSNPARSNLKLFATAVSAMKNLAIHNPEQNIAWIRSWNTATLVIKNSPLDDDQIKIAREFSESRGFDINWLPGLQISEANRFQLLQQPVYYLSAQSLRDGSLDEFIADYKYDIQPSSDNRPFFNLFFKWSSLKELLKLPAEAGMSLTGVGYPTLLLTLLQAFIAAIVLILAPLLLLKKRVHQHTIRGSNTVIYFTAIGLAFLFIEIAFIHKFTLILSQPLYAVAVTLCAFLLFSGLGSLYIQSRLKQQSSRNIARLLTIAVTMIALVSIIYIVFLPVIANSIMALPEYLRIISAFMMAAPLAFFMGMPFSLGLASLQQSRAELIPWAWGINGCASVLSAILAILLAIYIGFNGVMLCAVVLYLLAGWKRVTTS